MRATSSLRMRISVTSTMTAAANVAWYHRPVSKVPSVRPYDAAFTHRTMAKDAMCRAGT